MRIVELRRRWGRGRGGIPAREKIIGFNLLRVVV